MTANMPWFRMYVDFLNDPKMIALAFEDQRHFIGVLALKSDGVLDSGCDANLLDRIVAQRLWIDHAAIGEVKKRLVAGGLIDADWQPIAWERRQFKSDRDATAAERARRYRESRRVTDASRVTDALHRAERHGPVTRLDTDTDTDTEKEEKKERVRSPVGSRLPTDFPTQAEVEWCRQERPDLDANAVRDKFRDYWCGVPGAKGRKLDWPATWRNFVRGEFAGPRARAGPKQSRYGQVIADLTGKGRQPEEFIDVIATEQRRIG
jgi:hypothetical protein